MPKIILSKKGKILEFSIALFLILIGVSLRFLPHPPNFSPVIAISLFGGVYFSKRIAFILPILIMLISDIFIGYYEIGLMASVYGSFVLCVFLGSWLKEHKKWQTILGSSILSALIFFILTNFAVWAFTPWYAKTFSGIIQCYLMALPFFKNTLLGNFFYVAVLFGTYEIAEIWIRKKFRIIESLPAFVNAKI
ncbi:MAG: hypothetical protein NT012_00910 [Candidatus Nealsonbacteria bacterium]|nr:hypothetical protein [Candidatus Nealsonbacteria bacterium]